MKKLLTGAAVALALSTSANAEVKLGVSIFAFDDVWTNVLRNSIESYAKEVGASPQVEDAQNNVSKQLDQINNFIASGVDTIIVQPVDTSATPAITAAAAAAGIPLVYVNRAIG